MNALLTGGLLLAVILAGCVAEQAGDAADAASERGDVARDDTGTIVGLVLDDSLAPIPGVQVAVMDDEDASAVTDESGSFNITGLAPGTYSVAVQKLGYDSAVKKVDVRAGEATDVQFTLTSVAVVSEPYHVLLIGDGYFSCGAYVAVLGFGIRWGNLHACVWDEHKPRFVFEADKVALKGLAQEVTWEQNTALTSKTLAVFLQYKPVCDPFCGAEEGWDPDEGDQISESPVRAYYDLEDDVEDFEEDPLRLASLTFPDGEDTDVVIVFQQRMTHYITLFYGEHGSLDTYTALPDA